jgi:NAD(P)-dependent dehydrogenase (short-subunit alcohol dehydrogenase family)
MYEFSGKSGIVTGAAMGIGKSMSQCFARAGAAVVVADINEEAGQKTVAEIQALGGKAVFQRCDVSNASDVKALIAAAVSTYGALDFAVNNAAIELETTPLTDVPEDIIDRLFAVNLKGMIFCLQEEIKQMAAQGKGAICNVSSMNAMRPQPNSSVYTATKAAVIGLTKNAAIEAASQGVRINALCPGGTETPMMQEQLKRVPVPKQDIMNALSLIGRFAQPEEIAKAALWLCSDDASFTYGHAMVVDGGYTAR